MTKVPLNQLGNPIDATTFQNTLNANITAIQTAFENTYSRDGTAPNTLLSSLDANSNQILNLPTPATANSPLRLQDLSDFLVSGTVSNIPVGGTTGQVLAKTSNANYATGWTNSVTSVGLSLPADFTITNSPVTTTGTLTGSWATTPTGTGAVVRATSPTLVTPLLGTPTSVVLTNATGLPVGTGITGFGTGVAGALGANINNTSGMVTFSGALGTPTSGTLTNTTGLPVATGISGLGTGVATFLATPSSANLLAALTTKQGTGLNVFDTSPTLTTPVLGVATATSINKLTITAPATSAVLTIPNGVTLTGPAASGTAMTLGNAETVSGVKSFNTGTISFVGSTSGSTVLNASATASGTLTLPATSDTLVAKSTTDTLINKTLTATSNVLGGVTMTLGSDATGDIYYRNASGFLTRLGIGSATNVLTVSGGLPAWTAAAGGGNVSNSGTPTAGQLAVWTNSTTVKGNTGSAFESGAQNPTATSSATAVMMGMGSACTITPNFSGRVLLWFKGGLFNSATNTGKVQAAFGTGAAPANGAAASGTAVGPIVNAVSGVANQLIPFSCGGIITGLTVGTTYWLDCNLLATAGTQTLSAVVCSAMEF